MFEPNHVLSDDLDWMLGSEQVPQDILLEALISDCYPAIYQLGLFMLDDAMAAQRAAHKSLANALVQAYRYREEIGAVIYVYRLALESIHVEMRNKGNHRPTGSSPSQNKSNISEGPNLESHLWLAFYRLPSQERAILAMHKIQGWTINQLARLYELDVAQIEEILRTAQAKILSVNGSSGLEMSETEILKALDGALARRWPAPMMTEASLAVSKGQINKLSKKEKNRTRSISHVKELLLVVGIIIIALIIGWGINTFYPEDTPTATPIKTVKITQLVYIEPTQNAPQAIGPRTVVATPTPSDVFYEVDYGEDLSEIAKKLGVSEDELRELNRISPGAQAAPENWLLIPGRISQDTPEATPVWPIVRPVPQTPEASLSDLLERLKTQDGGYHTLWLDAMIVDYGPIGYVGPPRMLRAQAWFSEDHSLILVGLPGEQPEEIILRNGRTMYRAMSNAKVPWFENQLNLKPEDIEAYNELNLLFETIFEGVQNAQSSYALSSRGRATWAGQPAVQIEIQSDDGEHTAVIWVDESTGLTLREQWYSSADPQIISQEVAITGIAYDIDLPQDLFNLRLPWRGGFATDHTGAPENHEDYALPQWILEASRQVNPVEPEPIIKSTLDYIGAQITFDFRDSFHTIDPKAQADIYLYKRYIGTSVIGNPWTAICERSPDGRKLAYVSEPFRLDSLDSELRWINLDGPFGLGRFLEDMIVTRFAWAPDSRRMAVFGYDPSDPFDTGQLLILDTETGEQRVLLEADSANSLVWREDGKRLAMIVRRYSDSFDEQVLVLDPEYGGVVHRISFDMDGTYFDDWPMDNWLVDFPVLQGGLEQCAAPR